MIFEYGAMSSRYSIEADNKFTAYAAMVLHFSEHAYLVALYEPEDVVKGDSWLMNFKIEERLNEIFGGEGKFFGYLKEHGDEVKAAYDTIKQLV